MLLVCDSHPVQYRAPIYREMARRSASSVFVLYASDCSVRGYKDAEFGISFSWDDPILKDYNYKVLNSEVGVPLSGWGSLTGKGISMKVNEVRPQAVLLTGLNYRFDWAALRAARSSGIPLWLRCETQDEAFPQRSFAKRCLRHVFYRAAYALVDRFFFIGELNRKHYLRHGVREGRLRPARYFTVDRFAGMSDAEKADQRGASRRQAGIKDEALVCGFSGKLIEKKNPALMFEMVKNLSDSVRRRLHLYFLGAGPLEASLRRSAEQTLADYGVPSHFAGFSNQSGLAGHYLAMDMLVLPSRRVGETWGLVVNEAMQAGCAVAVSNAVGCRRDFSSWERFRVFQEGSSQELAKAFESLALFERSFSWARAKLTKDYSLEATVAAFEAELCGLRHDLR